MNRFLISVTVLAFTVGPVSSAGTSEPDETVQNVAKGIGVAASSSPLTTAPVSPRVELIEAAKRGDAEATRQILDAGTRDLVAVDGFGRTALHYAARLGHAEVMRLLINAGAPLEARDADEFTPLLRAIQGGNANIESIRLLLDAGADRNVRAGDVGALELARSLGATEVREILGR